MHKRNARHKALLQENLQVPRYTSYPTAPHFTAAVNGSTMHDWLSTATDDTTLSLYFHIPFCRKMCWYCGCNTRATRKYDPVSAYMDYLLKEIELVSAATKACGTVTHIHLGGGSPSMLSPADFQHLFTKIRSRFRVAQNAEIAIELDPREVTEAKVAAYAKAGVNRASLGIQDFHSDVQEAINRKQPFHIVYKAVHMLRAYDINDFNMDLLYGLPNQTPKHMIENIDYAMALDPSRISLFGYAHVPWMKKHMRLISEDALPCAEDRLEFFDLASDRIERRGFVPIGLDHFVHPRDAMAQAMTSGTLQRNFQGYTTDAADMLIGLGASAISALPQGYTQNTPANLEYFRALDADQFPTARGKALSQDDKIRRQIIEQLMCYFTLDLDRFCNEHNLDLDMFEDALNRLRELDQKGLVRLHGLKIEVPENARQTVRLVAAAFDDYLTVSQKKHAQVA